MKDELPGAKHLAGHIVLIYAFFSKNAGSPTPSRKGGAGMDRRLKEGVQYLLF